MIGWTGLVPLKPAGLRKTRLGDRLSGAERDRLSAAMASHVIDTLLQSRGLDRIVLLSDHPLEERTSSWLRDLGRGLNDELAAAAAQLGGPLLVVPADLPWLQADDVAALIDGAAIGPAIAPDRHESGTNGLALRDPADFRFAFGDDSFRRHRMLNPDNFSLVRRPALGFDLDTVADFEIALGAGLEL